MQLMTVFELNDFELKYCIVFLFYDTELLISSFVKSASATYTAALSISNNNPPPTSTSTTSSVLC